MSHNCSSRMSCIKMPISKLYFVHFYCNGAAVRSQRAGRCSHARGLIWNNGVSGSACDQSARQQHYWVNKGTCSISRAPSSDCQLCLSRHSGSPEAEVRVRRDNGLLCRFEGFGRGAKMFGLVQGREIRMIGSRDILHVGTGTGLGNISLFSSHRSFIEVYFWFINHPHLIN